MTQAIRKSTTTPELYFQIRESHISKKGKEYTNATVFARRHAAIAGDMTWKLSIVRCSKGDQFNRKSGRTLAKRAMFSGKYLLWGLEGGVDNVPTYDDAFAVYKDI